MTGGIDLYAHDGVGPNPPKVALLLEELGLSYTVNPLPFGPEGVKSPKYLAICPNGRVPALIDHGNGDCIVWESGACLYYLAEMYDKSGKYFGRNVNEKTEVMVWLTHQLSGVGPAQGNLNWFMHFHEQTSGEKPSDVILDRYRNETFRLYDVLEQRLEKQEQKGSEFIALDRYTIADMAFYGWLHIAFFAKLDFSKHPRLGKYVERIANMPNTKAAYAKLGQ
ncbi:hypothetical protein BZG36_04509 [Bifiguratus adelaidae]|uniref:Glutathione S-transferase n=1 Tax=Bifiguratus adelaidae TaxID=1938954 RepID=A0A261XVY4_9FUNG|nr:hypothetical protein BZG36_04509 [Bifiguratus adelaidae]